MDLLVLKGEIEEALETVDQSPHKGMDLLLSLREKLAELRQTTGDLPPDLLDLERALSDNLDRIRADVKRVDRLAR